MIQTLQEYNEKLKELELLAELIEKYEENYFPLPKPNKDDAVKFYIEQRGMTKEQAEKAYDILT